MRTIKITDETHRKLTATLGTLMAQTGRMQTYQNAIEALLRKSVIIPHELLSEVQNFIEKNNHKRYKCKEEFICQAIQFFLKWESEQYRYIKVPKEKYDRLNEALKEMNIAYPNTSEFMNNQIDQALRRYGK
jgi:hypothetical protein